ncbi:MAG: hypothetical protein H0T94_10835 [Acidimicrobiia bacterium]|nr:hypothetical protein [Acidimicrobiia bacterium]
MTTFRIISLADILSGKYCQHLEEPGRSWGRWRLNPDVLTLDLDDNRYEVDLEQCLTSRRPLRHRALRPRMHPPMGTGGAQ